MSKVQVDKSHYLTLNYLSKRRWNSYWYQINEIYQLKPKKILEIGTGGGVVSNQLKKMGFLVTTVDFDQSLKPDIVGDVRKLPFKNDFFDLVLCAQVLEHLPFRYFKKSLSELNRVTNKYVILTLPHFSITELYFGLKLIPYVPKIEKTVKIDWPIKHKFLGEHYWEIGREDYMLNKIKSLIKKSGFSIEKCFYPVENPKHQFFILKKI